MRPNGLSNVVVPVEGRVKINPNIILRRFVTRLELSRTILIVGSALIGMFLSGTYGPLCFVAAYFTLAIEPQLNQCIDSTARTTTFRDGVYRVNKTMFGVTFENGIGTVINGVLHVPYHVSKGIDINYGKTLVKPYYMNPPEDLETYGGPLSLVNPRPDDEIHVNSETDDSIVSYSITYGSEFTDQVLTWLGKSNPGELGSPVYAKRKGKCQFLSLTPLLLRKK